MRLAVQSVHASFGPAMDNPTVVFPDALDLAVSIRRFRVEERASALFRIELGVVSLDPAIDLERWTGSRAIFSITWNVERRLFGVVESARFVRMAEDRSGLATYAITIAPSLFRLGERVQSRLFQHRSIPSIVSGILDEHGIRHALHLADGDYPPLELRTQYGESDLTFVHRLLEEAGITFTFAEPEQEELAKEPSAARRPDMRIVLSDAPGQASERLGPPILFVDDTSLAHAARAPFVTEVSVL